MSEGGYHHRASAFDNDDTAKSRETVAAGALYPGLALPSFCFDKHLFIPSYFRLQTHLALPFMYIH